MKGAFIAALCLALVSGAAFGQMATTVAPAPAAKPAPVAKEDKFGTDASKVTLKMKDAALDDILHALADQTGNSRMEIPGNWEAQNITFDIADAPYWQALDRLCAQLKLCYVLETSGQPGNQKTEITLVDGKGYACVAAYNGPVIVKLAGVTATKRYQPAPAGSEADGLVVTLAWFCEDRLRPIESKAEVTKISGADGKGLALGGAPAAEALAADAPNGNIQGHVAVNGVVMRFPNASGMTKAAAPSLPTAGTITAKVASLPADLKSLKSIEGAVKLTFANGKKELKIEDVFGGKNDSAEVGKDKLTVTMARHQFNFASFQLQLTSDGNDADLTALAATAPYGVRLVDPNGDTYSPMRTFSAPFFAPKGGAIQMQGGNVQIQVQVQANGGANAPMPPVAKPPIQVAPIQPGGGQGAGPTTVTFTNLPNIDGAWTLIATVPESRVAKDFAFRLNDVPLP